MNLQQYTHTWKLFEEWYKKKYIPTNTYQDIHLFRYFTGEATHIEERLPFEFQQGVYLAFLREQGVIAELDFNNPESLIEGEWEWVLWELRDEYMVEDFGKQSFKDYNEALKQAITHAFQILNERNN